MRVATWQVPAPSGRAASPTAGRHRPRRCRAARRQVGPPCGRRLPRTGMARRWQMSRLQLCPRPSAACRLAGACFGTRQRSLRLLLQSCTMPSCGSIRARRAGSQHGRRSTARCGTRQRHTATEQAPATSLRQQRSSSLNRLARQSGHAARHQSSPRWTLQSRCSRASRHSSARRRARARAPRSRPAAASRRMARTRQASVEPRHRRATQQARLALCASHTRLPHSSAQRQAAAAPTWPSLVARTQSGSTTSPARASMWALNRARLPRRRLRCSCTAVQHLRPHQSVAWHQASRSMALPPCRALPRCRAGRHAHARRMARPPLNRSR